MRSIWYLCVLLPAVLAATVEKRDWRTKVTV